MKIITIYIDFYSLSLKDQLKMQEGVSRIFICTKKQHESLLIKFVTRVMGIDKM